MNSMWYVAVAIMPVKQRKVQLSFSSSLLHYERQKEIHRFTHTWLSRVQRKTSYAISKVLKTDNHTRAYDILLYTKSTCS